MIAFFIVGFLLGILVSDIYNKKIIDEYKRAISSWKIAFQSALESIEDISKEREKLWQEKLNNMRNN